MTHSEEDINALFNSIIENIEFDGMSLRKALKKNKVSSRTFYEWMDGVEERKKQYARACEERAESIFEEILEISDKQDADVTQTEDGLEIINHNVIARSRLQVDARKWMLGKMNPKKYGDRIQQDIDLNGTIQINIDNNDAKLGG